MDTIGEVFELMVARGESCSCHWQDLRFRGTLRWKRGAALMQDTGVFACPLRTLRAPECARGEHLR
eukprot:4832816-Lingulodinium_polyedra.AAC.1